MLPILMPGHGGVIGGIYQTAGKRSPKWHSGILYEGMFNRWVINRLREKLDRNAIPYFDAVTEDTDISLKKRVNRINNIYSKHKEVYVLEIHANAGGGEGIEGYTSRGITKSDKIAEMFLNDLEESGINNMRFDLFDGDKDKEAGFYTLVYTKCPAFLLECGFMDQKNDYNNLWNESYLSLLVDTLFSTIVKLKDIDSYEL